ncbi:MAG: hypothetical protein FWG04_05615 [Desulfovibrionaceae bacterium]|nr:hypothetical protein [Desulfovibrionaceae bacterium]
MQAHINSKIIKKSLLIWLAIIPIAIINGVLREKILTHIIGNYAFFVSGIILISAIFIITWIFLPRLGKGSQKTYIVIGLLWAALTVIFEFCMGIFVSGFSISQIITAYDITTGNIWLVVVIFTGFSPWLTAKLRHIF